MKKVILSILSLICILFLCSCTLTFIKQGSEHDSVLTLEMVKELSKKGDKLSWEDFEKYDGIDTGSGLYIRVYDINDDYKLSVTGTNPDMEPMGIHLDCKKTAYERIDIRYDDVEEFLERTSKIKKDTKRFIATVVSNGEMVLPAGKSESGMLHDSGMLVVSVSDIGNTDLKNDELYTINKNELVGNIKCPRLLNGDIILVEYDALKGTAKIPNYSGKLIKVVSIQRCLESGKVIKPLEDLPESYSLEQAKKDGCIVHEDLQITSGEQYFESFLANVKYNMPSSSRIAFYYSESDMLFVQDVIYNGTDFTVRKIEGNTEYLNKYSYLKKFIGRYPNPDYTYNGYLKYVLLDDNTVKSYDELWLSALSSKFGDYIPHDVIYSDKNYAPGAIMPEIE